MPIGHGSFEGMRRRRLRPSYAEWGLAAAGAGVLSSSAVALDPYDVAVLGLLCFITGWAALQEGRRFGIVTAVLAGLAFGILQLWRTDFASLELLRAAPGFAGLLALAVALSEMRYLIDGLAQTSMLDQVTRLPNRELFMRFLETESSRSMRYRLPFCLAILEIEDLESYSRTYGYWRTDTLLKELSKTMAETLRKSDVLGRLGGPQFAMLLPMTKSDGALTALQRVESAVRVLQLPSAKGGRPRPITWKAGLAEFPGDGQFAEDLLKAAGERLGIKTPDAPSLLSGQP